MAKIKVKTDKASINLSNVKLDEFSGAWQWVKDVLVTMHGDDVPVKGFTDDEKDVEYISGYDILKEARKALERLDTEIDCKYNSDGSDKIREALEMENGQKEDFAKWYRTDSTHPVIDDEDHFYDAASGTFIFKETYPAALAVKYAAETMIKYMWEKTKPCVEQVAFAEKVDEDDIPFDAFTSRGFEIKHNAAGIIDAIKIRASHDGYEGKEKYDARGGEPKETFDKICNDYVDTYKSYMPEEAARLTGKICARFFYEQSKK